MPSLQLDDFAHIASMKDIILMYLQQALKHHQKGMNLLIYGAPGTFYFPMESAVIFLGVLSVVLYSAVAKLINPKITPGELASATG